MHPDLISIGFLHIKTYGAFMALGFLAAWQVLVWLNRRAGRNPEPYTNLLMLMLVSGVVGARIAEVIENWSKYSVHPEQILRVDQGGLMFYGGLLLAIAVFFIWCRFKHLGKIATADLFVILVPLGHAFGRIGCFFYGCCHGQPSNSPLAVVFPRGSPAWYDQVEAGLITPAASAALPVLPTQLFESASLLILFVVLLLVYRRFGAARPGLVSGCYLVGYAVIRFGIEMLRGDPRAAVGVLSIGQTISCGLFLAGCAFILIAFRRGKL